MKASPDPGDIVPISAEPLVIAVNGCLFPQQDLDVLAVLETLQPPLAPMPPTIHPPAFPRVAFVSFASQQAMSHSESPLLGRLRFVP